MELWMLIVGAVILVVAFSGGGDSQEKEIKARLNEITKATPKTKSALEQLEEEELNKSFSERIIIPILRSFGERANKKTPKAKLALLKKQLAQAGNPGNLSVSEFMAMQRLLMVGVPMLAWMVGMVIRLNISQLLVGIAIGANMAVLVPRMFLQRKISFRKHMIQRKLPDVLDLLTVSVEAGLGFDMALQKVVEKFTGPIAEEFDIVLREAQMGKPRREALKDLSEKMEVEDLSNFLSAIIQADQLGVSIGNVLRIQSSQARQKRRQRAEEAAMKAPIKMMMPLVGCIFPTIMIVIMGASAYRFYDAFSKM